MLLGKPSTLPAPANCQLSPPNPLYPVTHVRLHCETNCSYASQPPTRTHARTHARTHTNLTNTPSPPKQVDVPQSAEVTADSACETGVHTQGAQNADALIDLIRRKEQFCMRTSSLHAPLARVSSSSWHASVTKSAGDVHTRVDLSNALGRRIVMLTRMDSALVDIDEMDGDMSTAHSLISIVGSATKRWRSIVKEVLIRDDGHGTLTLPVRKFNTVFTVRGPAEGQRCLEAFPGARQLKVRELQPDASLLATVLALRGSCVTSLDLSGSRALTDVSALSQLLSLQNLNLNHTAVANVGGLSPLVNLQTLDLWSTHVSDVNPLSSLVNLQTLSLSFTKVVDVSGLSTLVSLRTLSLAGTLVEDVSSLSPLVSLQRLNLNGAHVRNVAGLAPLSNLKTLDLCGTQAADVSALGALVSLQKLNLRGTPVSDVTALAALVGLEELDLDRTRVVDISRLSALVNLHNLILSHTRVVDVSRLSSLVSLKTLNLSCTRVVDVSGLAALVRLKTLNLDGTPDYRDSD